MVSPSHVCGLFLFLAVLGVGQELCDAADQGRMQHETTGRAQGVGPYVFEGHSFTKRVESEAGEMSFLETLKCAEDYEVGFVTMEPTSLLLPHYLDADWMFYVAQGNARISWVDADAHQHHLQERDLSAGDVFGLPGGTPLYLSNTHHAQRLRIFTLLHTAPSFNSPRHQSYYIAGGQNPSTVFSGFSWSTLQAAFNTNKEQLVRLLGEQSRGPIVYLNKQQMEKLNGDYSSRRWMWGWASSTEDPKPFSLLKTKPHFSNANGWITEVGGREYPLLPRPGIAVSLWNLAPGSMTAPHWNTHSTKIATVIEGEGIVEMSCPQRTETESKGSSELEIKGCQNVQAPLNVGDVFIIPAGLPSSQIASPNGRLQILCFDINARDNRRHFLAGTNSVLRVVNKEIMEVSYAAPWKEIGAVLDAQKDQVILKGPLHPDPQDDGED